MALSKTLIFIFVATFATFGIYAKELTEDLFSKIQNKLTFAFLICSMLTYMFNIFYYITLVWIAEKTLVNKNQNKVFKLRLCVAFM